MLNFFLLDDNEPRLLLINSHLDCTAVLRDSTTTLPSTGISSTYQEKQRELYFIQPTLAAVSGLNIVRITHFKMLPKRNEVWHQSNELENIFIKKLKTDSNSCIMVNVSARIWVELYGVLVFAGSTKSHHSCALQWRWGQISLLHINLSD